MRRLLLVLIAAALALGAVFAGAKIYSGTVKKPDPVTTGKPKDSPSTGAANEQPKVERRVVVFTVPKMAGSKINAATDLTTDMLDVTTLPADAFISQDVTTDTAAKHGIDGATLLNTVESGQPVSKSQLVIPTVEEKAAAAEANKGNVADKAFLDELTKDPTIVLFSEEQLSDLRLRQNVLVDVAVESEMTGFSDGTWVGREMLVSGATLRTTSLDVTGNGAKPVFYAKFTAVEADKVRAAQTIANGSVKVEPHREASAMPRQGHICISDTVCYEAKTVTDEVAPVEEPVTTAPKSKTPAVAPVVKATTKTNQPAKEAPKEAPKAK
jgi:hypothetical protein